MNFFTRSWRSFIGRYRYSYYVVTLTSKENTNNYLYIIEFEVRVVYSHRTGVLESHTHLNFTIAAKFKANLKCYIKFAWLCARIISICLILKVVIGLEAPHQQCCNMSLSLREVILVFRGYVHIRICIISFIDKSYDAT